MRSSGLKLGVAALVVLLATGDVDARGGTQHTIVPLADTRFEVTSRRSGSAQSYWCSAGSYAQRVLRLAADTPLYVVGPRGQSSTRPGEYGVVFSTSPPDGGTPPPSYSVSVNRAGEAMTVAAAAQYCFVENLGP
jgi:hypothetical protein